MNIESYFKVFNEDDIGQRKLKAKYALEKNINLLNKLHLKYSQVNYALLS